MSEVCSNYFFPDPQIWRDERTEIAPGNWKGRVIHRPSGDAYGHVNQADRDSTIRIKMLGLFFGAPLLTLYSVPLRILYLLSGTWVRVGYQEALSRWKIERHRCALNETPELAPGRATLYTYIALQSILRLTEATIKLATLPLAACLLMGAALIAIPSPFWARRTFALIQEFWSVNTHRISFLGSSKEAAEFRLFMNFQAPCMQPERIWEEHDIYIDANKKNDFWSEWRNLKRLLRESKDYFPEGKAEEWLGKLDEHSERCTRLSPQKIAEMKKSKYNDLISLSQSLEKFIEESDKEADLYIENPDESLFLGRKKELQNLEDAISELTSPPPEEIS